MFVGIKRTHSKCVHQLHLQAIQEFIFTNLDVFPPSRTPIESAADFDHHAALVSVQQLCFMLDRRMAAVYEPNPAREVVLEVGGEGGSLTLLRERAEDGNWRFRLESAETALSDVLCEDGNASRGRELAEAHCANSLQKAFTLLDRYPWFRLTPLEIHPEFLDAVIDQVRRRGGGHEEKRWREHVHHMTAWGSRDASKDKAYEFLQSLEESLNASLPQHAELKQGIRDIVKAAKIDDAQKHLRQPENAFLYHYAVPIIFDRMQTVPGIGEVEARRSFLSEFYRNFPQWSLATPARTQGHPFNKILGTKPAAIIDRWTGVNGASLTQACPDFAFREPFPFKIVFEGKYFEQGGATAARSVLATNIYQAFFYRGLPYVGPRRSSPAWDYEYACMLACDASESGTLKQAWDSLDEHVKGAFWSGASVYVMILRSAGPKLDSQSRA